MLTALTSFCLLGATSCGERTPNIPSKPDDTHQDETDKPGTEDTEKPGEDQNEGQKPDSKYDLKKVSELIAIGEALENDQTTTEEYYCKGIVEKVTDSSKNAIMFKDNSGSIFCYRVNGKTTISPALKVGEELVLKGTLKKYSNKPQFNYPQIVERHVEVEPPLTEEECTTMTIAEARNADVNAKIKLTGIVAAITKTQKFEDNGFYLIDETGSIFVYSKSLVSQVAKGNKVTILGKRDNYVGSSETNAKKQGYLGTIQVVSPVLLSNDNKTDNNYDTSWIKESTIKQIIDTPLSNNITTEFFKVKTFVNLISVNNNNVFVLNDIDNKTGSIVYSCNKAADFKWLNPYDGKLVEMYVAPHNVDVTESSYKYRFQPLEVIDTLENYKLDDAQKADYIATYHALEQFRNTYTSDPSIELMTTFEETLWDIKGATISYASDNEAAIKVENNVLHCISKGKANITVSVNVNGAIANKTIEITYNEISAENSLTVKEAIDTKLDTEIQVKGIVSSKIANKNGVYITDETGTIAVMLANADDLKDIHIGDEIVFNGVRSFKQKDPNKVGGQSFVDGASVLLNLYGKNEISTTAFVNSTIAELRALTEETDHTTTVFTIKASVERVKGGFSTNTILKDGENELLLYSGNAGDYQWLEQFAGKGELEAHVMLCDWNQKGLKGACLSVTQNGVTYYNNNKLAA